VRCCPGCLRCTRLVDVTEPHSSSPNKNSVWCGAFRPRRGRYTSPPPVANVNDIRSRNLVQHVFPVFVSADPQMSARNSIP
jgi:hypothetical protein